MFWKNSSYLSLERITNNTMVHGVGQQIPSAIRASLGTILTEHNVGLIILQYLTERLLLKIFKTVSRFLPCWERRTAKILAWSVLTNRQTHSGYFGQWLCFNCLISWLFIVPSSEFSRILPPTIFCPSLLGNARQVSALNTR